MAERARFEELTQLITSLEPDVRCVGNTCAADVGEIEAAFEVSLPETYRQFLLEYGALSYESVRILGTNGNPDALSLFDALILLRIAHPNLPQNLVPIEDLGSGWIACLRCSPSGNGHLAAPVGRLHVGGQITDTSFAPVAPGFVDYLVGRLREARGRAHGLRQLKKRVAKFNKKHEYDHAKGGKLPRNHVWRPYRYCIQDVVFGSVVVRHNRDGNHLQVDVFLPVDIPEYEPDAGAQALTVFLLSEAYKCGGTMEVEFTKNVEGSYVPASIRRIAERHEIELSCRNRLLPSESRQLYAALTDFSPEMRVVLSDLQEAGRLSVERACYAIHHGVWTKSEAEAIMLASHYPDSVLGGDTLPEQRHLYLQDLEDACAALLGGALDRRLAMKEHQDASGVTHDLEDDVRDLSIAFDPKTYAKTYVCPEDIPIPWLGGKGEGARTVPAYAAMHVLVRARDAAGLRMHMPGDLRLARQVQQDRASKGDNEVRVYVLVPSDFHELGLRAEEFVSTARAYGIGILVCPESMLILTEEAAKRLASSRVIRDD